MQSINVKQSIQVQKTPRVLQVSGLFGVENMDSSVFEIKIDNVDIESSKWNIGLIVGPSGSGKTTIAKKFLGDSDIVNEFDWHGSKSILDGFPASLGIKEITSLLTQVGFGSPPNWLRPYSVLSNGEKFRVTLARAIAESKKRIIFDEFTSVIDRQVAKIASHCIQKTVKKIDKQFVAVSCHFDIIEWLQPDWIIDTSLSSFFLTKKEKSLKSLLTLQKSIKPIGGILKSIII